MSAWKVLTIFFSHYGNTRECANLIHKKVGGDIVEIIPAVPYPADYETVVKQAKQELKSGYKPELKTRVDKISLYDVIFVGSPSWWNTIAPPVQTFLSEYDFSEKAIVPFITHGGSGLGRSAQDMARLCPHATVLEGLAVFGYEIKTVQSRVLEWLRKLGIQG